MGSQLGGAEQPPPHPTQRTTTATTTTTTMSEEHFDQWEHYNFEEKVVRSRNSGKQRSKLEAALNTNRPSPGGHERKIVTKLMNAERNKRARGGRAKQIGN